MDQGHLLSTPFVSFASFSQANKEVEISAWKTAGPSREARTARRNRPTPVQLSQAKLPPATSPHAQTLGFKTPVLTS